jgi:hypothetical protein
MDLEPIIIPVLDMEIKRFQEVMHIKGNQNEELTYKIEKIFLTPIHQIRS